MKHRPKAPLIEAALIKGTPVSTIARRYNVTPAYVYSLRKKMTAIPTPEELVPEPVVPAPDFVVEPPPPVVSTWQRVKNFFRGA